MKRAFKPALLVAALALCLACGGQGVEPRVNVNGVSDLAQVGPLLFVTATDANELRVFDLEQSPPRFVPAPNPLHPLSIPVVDRPVQLVSDVDWKTSGAPDGRHFVFARSADGREISVVSVVGAPDDVLRERARITSLSEEITAIAARSLPDTDPLNAAVLYVATYDGSFAHVRKVDIPKNPSTLNQTTCQDAQGSVPTATSSSDSRVVPGCLPATDLISPESLGCSVIQALAVMPDSSAGPRLAYSVRRTPQLESNCLGTLGPAAAATEGARLRREASFLVEFQDQDQTQKQTQTLLDFGGPVRLLVATPAYTSAVSGDVPAASRIFGVLDDESCGQGLRCRGVVAVDGPGGGPVTPARDPVNLPCGGGVGHYSCDVSGLPMIPVESGTPIIMGLDVGPGAIRLPQCSEPPAGRDLVGVVSRSNGDLQFFDAVNLREFNTAFVDTGSCTEAAGVGAPFKLDPGGQSSAPEENAITNVTAAFGAARDEEIKITFQGTLPGLNHLPAPAAGAQSLTVTADPTRVVQAGDELVVDPGDSCQEGAPLAKVTAITAVAGAWNIELSASPVVPPGCQTVSLRPASDWVATGTASGFLGRFEAPVGSSTPVALPMEPAERAGRYFYHRSDLPLPLAPQLALDFKPAAAVPPYTSYVIPTAAQFTPVVVSIDPTQRSADLQFVAVAGSVQFQTGTQTILVAYPSSDEVMQINTGAVTPGLPITTYNPLP